jgi:hypothetical protein
MSVRHIIAGVVSTGLAALAIRAAHYGEEARLASGPGARAAIEILQDEDIPTDTIMAGASAAPPRQEEPCNN